MPSRSSASRTQIIDMSPSSLRRTGAHRSRKTTGLRAAWRCCTWAACPTEVLSCWRRRNTDAPHRDLLFRDGLRDRWTQHLAGAVETDLEGEHVDHFHAGDVLVGRLAGGEVNRAEPAGQVVDLVGVLGVEICEEG